MKSKGAFIDPAFTYVFTECEVLLIFNSDTEGVSFREWWKSVGEKTFSDWHEGQEEHKSHD